MKDQPKKSGLPTKKLSFLGGSLCLFAIFGILQFFNPSALYSSIQFGCGLMILISIMTEKRTPTENKEPTSPEHLSVGKKISYFLGMLIFLSIAFMMGSLSYHEITAPINDLIGSGIYGLTSLGLGFASFLFGYKVFVPVARQGWIKNKLMNTAVISFLGAILMAINLPHQNQYRFYRYNSQAKFDLHNTFLVCQTYWQEKGNDKVCDLKVASQEEYGFVQSEYVNIDGKGTAANFTATAQHLGNHIIFTIDAKGKITEVKSQ